MVKASQVLFSNGPDHRKTEQNGGHFVNHWKTEQTPYHLNSERVWFSRPHRFHQNKIKKKFLERKCSEYFWPDLPCRGHPQCGSRHFRRNHPEKNVTS